MIFYSQAERKAAHNEFRGTGGSLYYLKHRPVIEDSDKVAVEIRDKNTGLVTARIEQSEGDDYEIDYTNGRIIFYEPVPQTAQSNSIISTGLPDGNPVYVVVDYEYEVTDPAYGDSSYGGRAEQSLSGFMSGGRTTANEYTGWIRDIRIGGTYIKDPENTGYELKGIDLSVYAGEHSRIRGEYAWSRQQGAEGFLSTDGGLRFDPMDNYSPAETTQGEALSITAETYLFDRLDIRAYHKRVDRGFSSTSAFSGRGKQITGGAAALEITRDTRLNLSYDTQQLIEGGTAFTALQTGAQRTDITTARITHDMGKASLTGEYRHIYVKEKSAVYESETNGRGDTAALRADYAVKKDIHVFAEQQIALNGEDNRRTSGGISAKLFGWLRLNVRHTRGSRGTATSIGTIARIDSKTEIYNTYSTGRSYSGGSTMAITTGAKKMITETMNLTGETRQSSSGTEESVTNSLGLSGKINERWGMSGGFESGTVQSVSGSISTRNAGSIGVSYIEKERVNASVRLEIRRDEGDEDRQQYLSYNAVQWKINRDTTVFGKINLSESINTTNDTTEAGYREFVIGCAYRPVDFDRLNMLAGYTYLEDISAPGQSDMSDIEERTAHIISAEAIYDLTAKWQLMQKIAFRGGEEKVSGLGFTKSQTWLWISRLDYSLNRRWQAGAEYRILWQQQARDTKQGILIEAARYIGKNMQLGAGYNFTDFNDNLAYLDYTARGPFIRLTARIAD
ncbi:MAG: hypothetical protein GXP46_06600 [Deferribacteres bacterium]|nr:hypothetical protein [Deferribacteres bacterium]